jgi:hypothetical protein
MRFLRRTQGVVWVTAVAVSAGLLAAAPSASARNVSVNVRATVIAINASTRVLRFAGTASDPGLGNGGLVITVHPVSGGFAGALTIVGPSGSVTAAVRINVRTRAQLVRFNATASVTAATGRLAGAHGTLTGGGAVTADRGFGELHLAGVLRGATGRSPGTAGGTRQVDGTFQGAIVSFDRSGAERIMGSVTGLTPGPAVAVFKARVTGSRARGTLTILAAGGTLTADFNLRLGPGMGRFRIDTGTGSVTGGTGAVAGARSVAPIAVHGTRDLVTQLINLRIRGKVTL